MALYSINIVIATLFLTVSSYSLSVSTKKFDALCKYARVNFECTFTGIHTNKSFLYADLLKIYNNDENHWHLVSQIFQNTSVVVSKVKVARSKIPYLTNEWCGVFPNTSAMFLVYIALESILPNALFNCHQLKIFHSYGNHLLRLDSHVFKRNTKLGAVSIQNSNLHYIPGYIFQNLSSINSIDLSDNNLTEFPAHEFPIMPRVTSIYLYSNNIHNMDEREIIYKFPNLQYLYIHNNLFECERLRIIINYFKRSTNVTMAVFNKFIQKRHTSNTTVEHIDCLMREQLIRHILRQIMLARANVSAEPLATTTIKVSTRVTVNGDEYYDDEINTTARIKTKTVLDYDVDDFIRVQRARANTSDVQVIRVFGANASVEESDVVLYSGHILTEITIVIASFLIILFFIIAIWMHKSTRPRERENNPDPGRTAYFLAATHTAPNNDLELL